MKHHKLFSYLPPIFTIILIGAIFLFTKPNVTGFTVFQQELLGDVMTKTHKGGNTGNFEYEVNINNFDLKPGKHQLKIEIAHKGTILSSDEKTITV